MSKQTKLSEYIEMPWHYSVAASEWEGQKGYYAWVSEMPNCSTFASTPSEALSVVAALLPSYLKVALESKTLIPRPESRDTETEDFGGTIVLRVPKSLHMGLKNAAKAEKTSLNQFALYALTRMVYQTSLPESPSSARPNDVRVLKGALKSPRKQREAVSTEEIRSVARKRGVRK